MRIPCRNSGTEVSAGYRKRREFRVRADWAEREAVGNFRAVGVGEEQLAFVVSGKRQPPVRDEGEVFLPLRSAALHERKFVERGACGKYEAILNRNAHRLSRNRTDRIALLADENEIAFLAVDERAHFQLGQVFPPQSEFRRFFLLLVEERRAARKVVAGVGFDADCLSRDF